MPRNHTKKLGRRIEDIVDREADRIWKEVREQGISFTEIWLEVYEKVAQEFVSDRPAAGRVRRRG